MSNELMVVKHGTTVVENANRIGLDQDKINFHIEQHQRLRAMGFDTVEVASGAVKEGHEYVIEEMGVDIDDYRNDDLPISDDELAIFGTAGQLQHWQEAGKQHGWVVGQILATHDQIDDNIAQGSPGQLMVRQIRRLTWAGSLVVVNENHAAALDEMEPFYQSLDAQVSEEMHGTNAEADNDWLAAHLAIALGAHTLLLLTNVDGLKVDGKIMPKIHLEDIEVMLQYCEIKSHSGSGGMESKLLAMQRAAEAGVEVVMGNAFTDVTQLMTGKAGTRVI